MEAESKDKHLEKGIECAQVYLSCPDWAHVSPAQLSHPFKAVSWFSLVVGFAYVCEGDWDGELCVSSSGKDGQPFRITLFPQKQDTVLY